MLEVLKYPKQPDPATPVILYHGVLSVLIGTIVLLKQGQWSSNSVCQCENQPGASPILLNDAESVSPMPPYPNIVTSKSHWHDHVQRTLNWSRRYQIGTFTCHVFPAKTKVCPRYDLENPRNLKVPSRLLSKKLKSTYVHIQSSPNPESVIQFCFQSFLPNKSQFKI